MATSVEVRAVVVDWAGTIVDHGSRAPVEAFREVFRRRDVPITVEEARGPNAILFGLGVGAGVSSGARDIRKRIGSGTI